MHFRYILYSALVLSALYSCKKKVPTASSAIEIKSDKEDSLIAPTSFISIKLAIESKALQEKLDREIKGVLFEENSSENNLFIKVTKRGPLDLKFEDESLIYQLPVNVRLDYTLDFLGMSKKIQSNLDMLVGFSSTLSIDSLFNIRTTTQAKNFQWISEPEIIFAGLKVPIKGMVDPLIKKQQNQLSSLIDGFVESELKSDELIQKIWNDLQEEVLISPEYNLYFKAFPEKIAFNGLKFQNQTLITSIGINTKLTTKTGSFPTSKKKKLPPLEISPNIASTSNLYLKTEFHYPDLTRSANGLLQGQSFEFQNGKKKVKIENITISGLNGKLIAELVLSGNVADKITLMGVPQYDNEKKEIRIKDLDYILETKKRLIRKANWLLQSSLEKKLERNLVFSVKNELKDLESTLKKEMSDIGSKNGITPNFALRKMEISQLKTLDKKLELLINLIADFEAKVHKIE